jgi:hypothetical protein
MRNRPSRPIRMPPPMSPPGKMLSSVGRSGNEPPALIILTPPRGRPSSSTTRPVMVPYG